MTEKNKMYSEEEFNQALEDQAIRIRINQFDKELTSLKTTFETHAEKSRTESAAILKAISNAGEERRENEVAIERRGYDTFVKKTDLKIYLFLVMATATAMSAGMAWVVVTAKGVVQ